MDRSQVAEHYRARGYQIRENARLRGKSGDVHGVELVAEGPMGALVVSFGDVAGVDAPEMGSIRRVARDVGATPVLAAATFSNELRRLAPQLGVVLVDDETLAKPAPAAAVSSWPGTAPSDGQADLEAHPWPASGRYKPADPVRAGAAVEVDELVARLQDKAKPAPAGEDLWPLRTAHAPAAGLEASQPSPGVVGAPQFDWLGRTVATSGATPASPEEKMTILPDEDDVQEVAAAPPGHRVARPIIEAPRRWLLRTLVYAFATAFFLWLFLR